MCSGAEAGSYVRLANLNRSEAGSYLMLVNETSNGLIYRIDAVLQPQKLPLAGRWNDHLAAAK